MQIDVITAFPEIMRAPIEQSILKQAQKRTGLNIRLLDLRDFASDKHKTLDDTPYGGGPGMILKAEPLFAALNYVAGSDDTEDRPRVVFPTPQGPLFTQSMAAEMAEETHLVFICGHYKAVDQRVIDTWVSDEVSIGDFILSGGEIPALLMIDGIVRLIPGVLNDLQSAKTDSFQDGLLDCTYYTRPEIFRDMPVPEVLLSGNHQRIAEWRKNQRLERTRDRRPDLYEKYQASVQKARKDKKKK